VPLAIHQGRLVEADGCIWLISDVWHLALWPKPFTLRWDGLHWQILDGEGRVVATTGETITVTGGEATRMGAERVPKKVADLVGVEIPEPCSVHEFWQVVAIHD